MNEYYERMKIVSSRDNGGVKHEVYSPRTDFPDVNPSTVSKPYDRILKLHEEILKEANLREIKTTF